ncbi:T9SS type A sorting domain-containing protein [Chryseobacterium populi]|uniref:Por secretion system C-terminal sorting domain containing protein n=1 Tax=Chryseobacterium populi TaxID=1144316 RepID=J2K3U6_9FLAO|nr:T9SS type A sorting domain-containing protein [Chryseobacterium populi]EJL74850.1 Por secretion system C-terminal sorting domain containing protein [Chryseobacterium populi]
MRKKILLKAVLLCTAGIFSGLSSQCPSTTSIYTLTTNGKKYEVVKLGASWPQAAQCAVQRGGYLAEINSMAEQNAVFTMLQSTAAGINLNNTTAPDGGGASYVWIGGYTNFPNQWLWDGNNDNSGTFFWSDGPLTSGGVPIYTNWGFGPGGTEPDNFQGVQNNLGLALTAWPMGQAGQWNDLYGGTLLYYVIEYDSTLGTDDLKSKPEAVRLYPSVVNEFLQIKANKNITGIAFTDVTGRKLKSVSINNKSDEKIDCTSLVNGIYFVEIIYQDNTSSKHKIIKAVSK